MGLKHLSENSDVLQYLFNSFMVGQMSVSGADNNGEIEKASLLIGFSVKL